MRRKSQADIRDMAAAIVQRAPKGHVVQLSDPPSLEQALHLMAARIERRPIVIMAPKCLSMDEWMARYGSLKDR